MNKTKLLGCLLIVPLLAACGNGGKTLVCERTEEDGLLIETHEYTFTKDDVASGLTSTIKYDFSKVENFTELGCTDLDDCKEKASSLKSQCDADNDYDNCSVKDTKDTVSIIGKVSKEAIENVKDKEEGKYENIKKNLEDSGYKCK